MGTRTLRASVLLIVVIFVISGCDAGHQIWVDNRSADEVLISMETNAQYVVPANSVRATIGGVGRTSGGTVVIYRATDCATLSKEKIGQFTDLHVTVTESGAVEFSSGGPGKPLPLGEVVYSHCPSN